MLVIRMCMYLLCLLIISQQFERATKVNECTNIIRLDFGCHGEEFASICVISCFFVVMSKVIVHLPIPMVNTDCRAEK